MDHLILNVKSLITSMAIEIFETAGNQGSDFTRERQGSTGISCYNEILEAFNHLLDILNITISLL